MKFLKTGFMLLAATLVLTGCSSTGDTRDEGANVPGPTSDAGGLEIGRYGDGSGGVYVPGGGKEQSAYGSRGGSGEGGRYAGASPDDPTGPLAKRVIYFLYDSSDVQPEYIPVINNHAHYLASDAGKSVVLEGHADERGSPEYNVALGEQRAKSVANLMKLQGVSDRQIQVVSFGEEKPAVPGNDESTWQQNRRVEISYPSR